MSNGSTAVERQRSPWPLFRLPQEPFLYHSTKTTFLLHSKTFFNIIPWRSFNITWLLSFAKVGICSFCLHFYTSTILLLPNRLWKLRLKKITDMQLQAYKTGLLHFCNSRPDLDSELLESKSEIKSRDSVLNMIQRNDLQITRIRWHPCACKGTP